MRTGIAVYCEVCRHQKAPHGRSAPLDGVFCSEECEGYSRNPLPGCLWPDETEEDFGFTICDRATKEE